MVVCKQTFCTELAWTIKYGPLKTIIIIQRKSHWSWEQFPEDFSKVPTSVFRETANDTFSVDGGG